MDGENITVESPLVESGNPMGASFYQGDSSSSAPVSAADKTTTKTEDLLAQQKALLETASQDIDEHVKNRKGIDSLFENFKKKIETPAKWENSQEYKNAQMSKKSMILGFSLLMLGMVGAAKMRLGAKGAMAGLTAALNGWMAGDEKKWNDAKASYSAHMDFIKSQNDQMQKEYNQIVSNEKDDYETKRTKTELFLKSLGFQIKESSKYDFEEMKLYMKAQNDALARVENHMNKMEESRNKPTQAKFNQKAFESWQKKPENEGKGADDFIKEMKASGKKVSVIPPRVGEKKDSKITVTAPDGSIHPFDTQAQADEFKKLAGIK